MPRIFILIFQVAFLLLMYLFVARAVRAVMIDVYGPRPGRRSGGARRARRSRAEAPQGGGERSGRSSRKTARELLVTDLDGKRTLPLRDVITFGRAASCDLQVADNYVSNVHARIYAGDGGYWLEDLGSTNGTFLNEEKVTESTPVTVGTGDTVRVGKATLELRR